MFIVSKVVTRSNNPKGVETQFMDMSETDTKDRILRTLRRTDEPALSAKKLAEELDVSVHTVNNHTDGLEEEGRIETTKIGNAAAYYLPHSELPSRAKPDHTCGRCGREISRIYDHAKIEYDAYFDGMASDEGTATFYIFCRFCYADFIGWVEDPASQGEYPFVHTWDIPDDQLEEVRDDPDVQTMMPLESLEDEQVALYNIIKENQGDGGVFTEDIIEEAQELGLGEIEVKQRLKKLARTGYVYDAGIGYYRAGKS